jgi:hypothetical protein
MARRHPQLVRTVCTLALCAASVGGCSSAGLGGNEQVGSQQEPIFGGTPDTTHDAVMALLHFGNTSVSGCSGTTIAKKAGSGILLTAAHCVLAVDANDQVVVPLQVSAPSSMYVVPGADWQTGYEAGKVYFVSQITVNPQYDGKTENPFDLALVRYLGTTDTTPIIPVLSLAEDQLAVGSPFTLVGYGKTDTNPQNTQRRAVDRVVANLTARQILYDQTDGKGTCQGDSGGPALVQSPGGLRVAGVTSYGDFDCSGSSVSVRVSSGASFIQGVLNTIPSVLSCDDCKGASIGPDGTCFPSWLPCETNGSACNRFLACVTPCQTSACYDACVAKNQTGAQQSDAALACQCTTACSKECANDRSCGTPSCGGLTVPGALCTSCIQQNCCPQAEACGNDAGCTGCFQHSGAQCDSDPLYAAFLGCVSTCNGNPCKIALPTGAVSADAGSKTDGGAAAGQTPAGAATADAAGPVQYQLASAGVPASEGGCSCRQTRSDGRGLDRALAAFCLAAIAALRVRSKGRTRLRRPSFAR